MMKFIVALLGYKPKDVTRKKNETNIEKKFRRLLKNGYSIDRARYISRL
jgi:transcriptional regulator of NAD metabolism